MPCRAAGRHSASHLSFGNASATAAHPRLCQVILLSVARPGPETNRCSISQLSSESETLIVGVYIFCSGFTRWLHLGMPHTASASPSKPRRPRMSKESNYSGSLKLRDLEDRANASPICITSLVSRQCTEAPRQSFGTASASA